MVDVFNGGNFWFVATWVDRFSVDDASMDNEREEQTTISLTSVQRDKFSHFFTYLLDHDRDDIISDQDFEIFIEVSTSGFPFPRTHTYCSFVNNCPLV